MTRIALLPKHARQISVEIAINSNNSHSHNVSFVLRSSKKSKYLITIPTTSVDKKVMEGTKFSYKRYNEKVVFRASGPLHVDTVLLVS